MRRSDVDEYYLHMPDPETSLLESLKTLHSLHEAGKIKRIGLSNYHAEEVQRCFDLCRSHNLTPPTVYQGIYSPLNRLIERELLPVLRENNCDFVAYNPLAGGLLAGKHDREACKSGAVPEGRFKNNQNYLPRFFTEPNFAAVAAIKAACDAENMTTVEATFRWLLCGSALRATDGVLLGASSPAQLQENLAACKAARTKGALPEAVQRALDGVFEELTAEGAFKYWRGFSLDHPGRDEMDWGASYDSSKASTQK